MASVDESYGKAVMYKIRVKNSRAWTRVGILGVYDYVMECAMDFFGIFSKTWKNTAQNFAKILIIRWKGGAVRV